MFALPHKNIEYLNLLPGMKVADFGAGTGAYAYAAAESVTKDGQVIVIDIQKDLLEKIAREALENNISNIKTLWGDIEVKGGVKLADRLVDAVIVSNVLFQTDSKYGVALEAKRILKPDGKVLLVDWQDSYGGLGPDPDHVFTEAQAEEVFKEAGFIVDNRFNAGDHHYGLVFKLASR